MPIKVQAPLILLLFLSAASILLALRVINNMYNVNELEWVYCVGGSQHHHLHISSLCCCCFVVAICLCSRHNACSQGFHSRTGIYPVTTRICGRCRLNSLHPSYVLQFLGHRWSGVLLLCPVLGLGYKVQTLLNERRGGPFSTLVSTCEWGNIIIM